MADDLVERRSVEKGSQTDPASIGCPKTPKYTSAGRKVGDCSSDQLKGAIQKLGFGASVKKGS